MISQTERFMKYVYPEPNTGCWVWGGGKQLSGYGVFRLNNTTNTIAHRAAVLLLKEPLERGKEINHLCNNKWCVNPDHLEQVTHQENIDYRDKCGGTLRGEEWYKVHSNTRPKGEAHASSKLTEEAVKYIRQSTEKTGVLRKRFNVSGSLIRAVRRGEGWKHIKDR
jgi:hypothetical protein